MPRTSTSIWFLRAVTSGRSGRTRRPGCAIATVTATERSDRFWFAAAGPAPATRAFGESSMPNDERQTRGSAFRKSENEDELSRDEPSARGISPADRRHPPEDARSPGRDRARGGAGLRVRGAAGQSTALAIV